MDSANQRWLSLTGICTTLNISHGHAKWLAKKGFLSYIPGRNGATWLEAKFLDPTPEYAERLKMAEALYGRLNPIPKDLDLAGLLTIREIAQIMGWTINYARQFAWEKKLPSVTLGKTEFYSISTVRRLIWQRKGRARSVSKQLAPFLISELIDFFFRAMAEAEQEVPTDKQFAEDALLERKLIRMGKFKSPEREMAFAAFYRKMELAKSTVSQMRGASFASGRASA